MTNGDYSPFFQHEQLPNDSRQKRVAVLASAFAALGIVALILATVLSMRACSW